MVISDDDDYGKWTFYGIMFHTCIHLTNNRMRSTYGRNQEKRFRLIFVKKYANQRMCDELSEDII